MEVAKTLFDTGRWDEGIALLKSTAQTGRRSAQLHHTLAIGLWHQQRLAEAADQFALAVGLKPITQPHGADYAAVLAPSISRPRRASSLRKR